MSLLQGVREFEDGESCERQDRSMLVAQTLSQLRMPGGQEAADSGLKDWSRVDPSIYSICFTGASISAENWCKRCNSIDHVTETCPLNHKTPFTSRKRKSGFVQGGTPPKKRPAPRSIMETCRRYNLQNGECRFWETCMYQHRCETCGDYSHPSPKCFKEKKASTEAC